METTVVSRGWAFGGLGLCRGYGEYGACNPKENRNNCSIQGSGYRVYL